MLSDDKDLFQAFTSAGSKVYTPETMPKEMLDPIEKFVLTVYRGTRWQLFKRKKQTNKGWLGDSDGTEGPGILKPVLCAQLPSPEAVMEFQKCGCKGKPKYNYNSRLSY